STKALRTTACVSIVLALIIPRKISCAASLSAGSLTDVGSPVSVTDGSRDRFAKNPLLPFSGLGPQILEWH
ncbi:MAG TPA: hypothetical protein VLQ65_08725, partial [Saliniramus sp.]|nr:hypothetical protein [Saliniramus sp.]